MKTRKTQSPADSLRRLAMPREPNRRGARTKDPVGGVGGVARYIRRRRVSFWGQKYMITPRLIEWIHGDGRKLLSFTPLATRPDYYVVRVDSKADLDGDGFHDGLLEEIYEAIEDQFYRSEETWEHDNGRTYHKHNPWPALNDSCGCSWGEMTTLETADLRTEAEVRAAWRAAGVGVGFAARRTMSRAQGHSIVLSNPEFDK